MKNVFALVSMFLAVVIFSNNADANELLNAALSGDADKVEKLLAEGAEVDPLGPASPLYFAAQNGHLDIVEILVEHGADVNAMSSNGTPLHIAARRNRAKIVEVLLISGADPHAVGGNYRHTPLHMAAGTGAIDAARVLLENGADINARTRWFEPPIHFAAKKGKSEFVEFLRKAGAMPFPVPGITANIASAGLEAGRIRAIECTNCHLLQLGQTWGSEVPQVRGPSLWDVVGRDIASLDDFKYSEALSAESGTWTFEKLNEFLADPTGYVPGTEMFAGHEQDHEKRTALIAYLRKLSENPVPLP